MEYIKNCIAFRTDVFAGAVMITRFWLDKSTLTENEISIFRQWSQNAKNVNLPLLTQMEALKNCNNLEVYLDSSGFHRHFPGYISLIKYLELRSGR